MTRIKKIIVSLLMLNALTLSIFAGCAETIKNSHGTCSFIDKGTYCWYVCSDGTIQPGGKPKAFDEPAIEEGLVF